MRPLIHPIESWEFDEYGRPVVIVRKREWGYHVALAQRLGGAHGSAHHPEDAEMLAAQLRRRRGA